ncbi:MAG: SDR family NAD(P)-dependent oxidoreductase [Burkholderiaceae bacterium]|nr:SDR family NAD(P)-dependent oxidoreductase [Burkholderiaceae bacterium]
MKLFIVTGASRGLGRAIAEQLLQPSHHVLAIARRTDPALETLARERGARVTAWSQDLADAPAAAQRLATWLAQQPAADAVLINNAAALSTPAPLGDSALDELSLAARVGLEAPLLLSAAFLRATRDWGTDRRILNISSGLGRRAMAGSASYCAVKAGMDHFSRAVALEEAARPGGARIVSLAPGIIDTDMQVQLRSADRSRFPDGAQFEAFKTEGRLDSPEAAAAKVLRFLARNDFGQEPVSDVRQA